MNIVRSLVTVSLLALSGLAAAQSNPPVVTPHEHAIVRSDNRDIAHERHALVHSRHELHRAQRASDMRRVKEIRRHIRHERRALHHERLEHRHDVHDMHRG
ncbi:MAG: hypothetical protein JWN23_833 [Rhodocyclales bacterium]|nr:hypothetical protein [Rhodocyclales bacterium]